MTCFSVELVMRKMGPVQACSADLGRKQSNNSVQEETHGCLYNRDYFWLRFMSSDLGSCLEIWAAANAHWPLFRRHALVDALISFHIFIDTYIPVLSSQGVIFTFFFLPDICPHTTQDNGVRLSFYTGIKNCPISDPSKPWLIIDASFYHRIVPVHAISSHRAFCYHL